MNIPDINQQFSEYQHQLDISELHLKLLPEFNYEFDELLQLLNEVKEKPLLEP